MGQNTEKPILIVEDDSDIRESLQDFLEMEGFRVVTAKNGKEGIEKLAGSNPNPCLILLDLFMPVMNGADFLSELVKLSAEFIMPIPVVAITAAPPAGELAAKVKPLISGFLRKPVDLDHFLDTVKKHCNA